MRKELFDGSMSVSFYRIFKCLQHDLLEEDVTFLSDESSGIKNRNEQPPGEKGKG